MERREDELSFGVFKPVGHVVIAFPRAEDAAAGARALADLGLAGGTGAVRSFDDGQMIDQIDRDIERASPLAAIGQELNLVRAHRALAEKGYHFVVVRAADAGQAARVAEIARGHGAERAHAYGNFIIEELIEPPYGLPQVSESPDRGLDMQTPSGCEADSAGHGEPAHPVAEPGRRARKG